MNKLHDLYPSLVGYSIEYNFMKKKDGFLSIEKNIACAKDKIDKDIKRAFSAGSELCMIALSELLSFYSKEPYYMAVRSSITLRRYRPLVIEYLGHNSVEDRASILLDIIKESNKKGKSDKNRDLKITILRYFLATYKSRIDDFKSLLTREEYLIVVS